MDFFSRQEAARRATVRLVVYFVVAVALIFQGVNTLLYLLAVSSSYDNGSGSLLWHAWSAQALTGTLILIGGGSLLEWFRLREGGKAVAEMMGARQIDFATRHPLERQLLNVIEEMSIASGVSPPIIYVLDNEQAVNAFVAGYDSSQSILVVTQGTLEILSREELQGVIGHEFSHILNGDMRLNMRLLAILAGILAIGQMGGFLMRSVTNTRHRSRNNDRNTAVPAIFIFGLGLWLIGYIGLFFGRLIKAAVSRERERLADAASVQFTRYPDGLAGALYKISLNGSHLANFHAEEMSHMCFGESLAFSRIFATHPPIDERIKAIAPTFLTRVKYKKNPPSNTSVNDASRAKLSELMTSFAPTQHAKTPMVANPSVAKVDTGQAIEYESVAWPVAQTPSAPTSLMSMRVGDVTVADLQSAQRLHQTIPVEVSRALQSTTGAKAVLFALIATHQKIVVNTIQAFFAEQQTFAIWVQQLAEQLQTLDKFFALPIVDLALPRLSMLDAKTANEFLIELRRFVLLNDEVSVLEFSLLKIIEQHIQPTPTVFKNQAIDKLASAVAQLVATLLQYGAHQHVQRAIVYQQLLAPIFTTVPPMPSDDRLTLKELDRALRQFRYLTTDGKKTVINLVATTIQCDGVLHLAEYELLRAIAALLSCPLPLLQLEWVVS